MARLGTALLKGAGVLLLALVVLGVIATIVSIVLSIVAAVVTLAFLAVCVLAVVGLASLLRDGTDADPASAGPDATDDDPADRLRSRYVDGRLDDDEFERELDRLLETDDFDRTDGLGDDSSRTASDRTRLWDR
ncbi:SHOCT domain-containing protein [Natronorubrum halophilum]|uniref:SHOCT domain-containing protein n=1 Tax=Natronorubrum halophilum TaxID=1702106 RepID=UPI0010C17A1F|nr:SHOCT domain-containing protein [Natronorubrum halophilum]